MNELKMQRDALEQIQLPAKEMTTPMTHVLENESFGTVMIRKASKKWIAANALHLLESMDAPVAQVDRASAF
jgi:hypothetical protein